MLRVSQGTFAGLLWTRGCFAVADMGILNMFINTPAQEASTRPLNSSNTDEPEASIKLETKLKKG